MRRTRPTVIKLDLGRYEIRRQGWRFKLENFIPLRWQVTWLRQIHHLVNAKIGKALRKLSGFLC